MKKNNTWRGFFEHFGMYLVVIAGLAGINLMAGGDSLWFHWPAMGWGVAIAFHLLGTVTASVEDSLSKKWQDFLGHFGSYAIIISMLAFINLFTGSDTLWFLFPAFGWGIAIAVHLLTTLTGSDEAEEAAIDLSKEEQQQPAATSSVPPTVRGSTSTRQLTPEMQAHLDKAQEYQRQIKQAVRATDSEESSYRLQDLTAQVDEWVAAIEDLAQRVDAYRKNQTIRQDLENVPDAIHALRARLDAETDEATRAELKKAIANRRNQLETLEHLHNTMNRAEIKIENTLSSLGTIYSQLLTSQSTNHVADYSRLSAEVEEERRVLNDQLEALEEVKLGRMG